MRYAEIRAAWKQLIVRIDDWVFSLQILTGYQLYFALLEKGFATRLRPFGFFHFLIVISIHIDRNELILVPIRS